MSTRLRVASAQYPIGYFRSWDEYRLHVESWTDDAVRAGATLLLWPEYAAMELASLFDERTQQDLQAQLSALQTVLPDFRSLFSALAARHGIHLQPGTIPVLQPDGAFRNRAFLFGPEGELGFQDKLQMTRFESEQWFIQAGDDVRVFDTALGKVAISTCYDSEFPLIARKQVELGATLILVPSCTDTLAGYHRVRIGCQARALENQCYVVQAATVGEAAWSPAVDENTGAAAFYGPVDRGFPADGVLAMGELNQPGWVYADLDLTAIETVRASGQVLNHRDWEKQKRLV